MAKRSTAKSTKSKDLDEQIADKLEGKDDDKPDQIFDDGDDPEGSDDLDREVAERLSMGPGYERIIERTFKIDEWQEHLDLEEALTIGNVTRAEYGLLADALDNAEDNARRAHRLYCNAVVALEGFEADASAIEGGLWDQASAELQNEHAEGTRKKAPTKDDIKARMATLFSDEVRNLAMKRAKAKTTVDHLSRIADLWRNRCHTLRTFVEKARH